tara:strand:+ start:131 stop:1057 length:927 start_codon:yes stop_codon:yes gene_type:complete
MIRISQGDIKSIGLEVFFKALLMLPKEQIKHFILYGNKNVLKKHLTNSNNKIEVHEKHIQITNKKRLNFINIGKDENISPFDSLKTALENMNSKDVLFTLPMAKSSFNHAGLKYKGHTDYFRKIYKKECLMTFMTESECAVLATDHIPLKDVSSSVNINSLLSQINLIDEYKNILFKEYDIINLTGINPHAGEYGEIGHEDRIINEIINNYKFNNFKIKGPLPADSLFNNNIKSNKAIDFFMYHDQALTSFKSRNKLIGINITLGLPFIRLSVDHGTAPNLYNKDLASPIGCYYALLKSMEINRCLNE